MTRRVVVIIVFLLFGAVVNFIIAWACALREHSDRSTQRLRVGYAYDGAAHALWTVETVEVIGTTTVQSHAYGMLVLDALGELRPEDALPRWCSWLRPERRLEVMESYFEEAVAHGLPMRSMMRVRDIETNATVRGRSPWPVQGVPQWVRGQHRGMPQTWPVLLPLQPLWTGFMVNTLLYALVLWLPFVALPRCRRALRRKRRLCEACAYPIGVSQVCTECGAAVHVGAKRSPINPPVEPRSSARRSA